MLRIVGERLSEHFHHALRFEPNGSDVGLDPRLSSRSPGPWFSSGLVSAY
jgi:hypothetical protein